MNTADIFRDDHDSPWKEALEHYFPEFLSLLFPSIYAEIDWTLRFEFLDHELQQVVGDAELGRRYADKLVKVFTQEGRETWVLIHVEVQGSGDAEFAERMFVYYYRLFDRYHVDVISVAVLTDHSPNFHPDHYRRERCGCVVEFRFPTQKLLEWEPRWSELEASPNPFSLVVLAHLTARATRDGESRKECVHLESRWEAANNTSSGVSRGNFPGRDQTMRELPTIELTEEQTDEAERIRDILAAKSAVVVDYMSRLLASRKNQELFGETEFLIRDAVHRLGAEGFDAALAERKKRGTKVRASCARSADATPNS